MRCHEPAPEFGSIELGLAYVDFDVPQGTAEGIARFYNEVMQAPARVEKKTRAVVSVGRSQRLLFTETSKPLPEYDNHHIQIYIADFGTPYHWLKERDLITMETDANEWRFQWIVDPKDGRKLFQIEHEVRSMKHRLFARPLVNRNHGITNMTYEAELGFLQGNVLGPVVQPRERLTASRQRSIRASTSLRSICGSKRRSACHCAASSSRDFHRLVVSPAR